uniref:Uncharacterized protein n=1 Tax=Arcella intermedia TaxID=1963864 RepID=A0A6B2LWI4_9EUKA
MHIAAQHGQLKVVDLLLRRTIDIDQKNEHHQTPLHLAAIHGHHQIVKSLLNRNASIEARDKV